DVDADIGVAGPRVERNREVEPQRPETRVIADADPRAELDLVEAGGGPFTHRPGIDERHYAQRAVEQAGTDARLGRELDQRAAPGGVAQAVARPDPLVGVAAHRSSAARVEPPRRCDRAERCARNA